MTDGFETSAFSILPIASKSGTWLTIVEIAARVFGGWTMTNLDAAEAVVGAENGRREARIVDWDADQPMLE